MFALVLNTVYHFWSFLVLIGTLLYLLLPENMRSQKYASALARCSLRYQRYLAIQLCEELGLTKVYVFDTIGDLVAGSDCVSNNGIRYKHVGDCYAVLSNAAQGTLPMHEPNVYRQLSDFSCEIDDSGCFVTHVLDDNEQQ